MSSSRSCSTEGTARPRVHRCTFKRPPVAICASRALAAPCCGASSTKAGGASRWCAAHRPPSWLRTDGDHAPGGSGTPEYIGWWTRYFARELLASACTPLGTGRHALLARASLLIKPELEILLGQGTQFELSWDHHYVGLLQLRAPSASDDGRVKMWRKRAREGRLPPVLVWWSNGLHVHVVLDGHDRLHAALLEGIAPDIIALSDVTSRGAAAIDEARQHALQTAAYLQTSPRLERRGEAANAVLRSAWDPRTDWDARTPGFPLDGGIERWLDEVRGTELERLAKQRTR